MERVSNMLIVGGVLLIMSGVLDLLLATSGKRNFPESSFKSGLISAGLYIFSGVFFLIGGITTRLM